MALPVDQLAGPLDGAAAPSGTAVATVDAEQVIAYAAATNDSNPAYKSGAVAPPVFGVVPTWDATIEALDKVVPADVMPMLLHADQDMRFTRPLVAGQTLSTVAVTHGVRPMRAGTWVTMRVTSVDLADGEVALEQYATMFIRGWCELPESGSERPDRSISKDVRQHPVGEFTAHIDADQTWRYAEASGDGNRIHLDDDFARGVGLSGVIVHGMCTMAMCAQAVVETLADGDPFRLARLAVRFSKPVLPDTDLVVAMYVGDVDVDVDIEADRPRSATGGVSTFAFEASSGGDRVIRDGLAEIRA